MNGNNDDSRDAVERGLQHDDPLTALRALVQEMLDAGVERHDAYERMASWRLRLQEQGREADEDVVLEVMDFLLGWSGPEAKL